MKGVLIGALLAALVCAEAIEHNFDAWAQKYNKAYASEEERELRRTVFNANVARIEEHNAKHMSFSMGLNAFSDLTHEEFASTHLSSSPLKISHQVARSRAVEAPQEVVPVDWRTGGYVTPVKNQGSCGSCWTFATTGAVESARAIATQSTPISLSEQQLLDCSHNGYNAGCDGGAYDLAFQYIMETGGLETEESYPYTAVEAEDCNATATDFVTTISGYTCLTPFNEKDLQKTIGNVGPVSVAIDASQESFKDYTTGVYYEPNCNPMNLIHEVLAVGLGHDDTSNMDYYIVKNSWGESWGQAGYIWMAANMKDNCGISSYPCIPYY
ncbi:cathepsin L2 [Pelomyxa schiedti]|nr:cathepsin L2 [Pelomyxa schiedti]